MTARKVAGKAAGGALVLFLLVGCANVSPEQTRLAQACFDAALRVVACQLTAHH